MTNKVDIMITEIIEKAEMNIELIEFADGITLAEFYISNEKIDLASVVNSIDSFLPEQFMIFSQTRKLMENQSYVIRAQNIALSNFEVSSITCHHTNPEYIYLLFKAPRLTCQMLKSYSQKYWVLADPYSDKEWPQVFIYLQKAFTNKNLRQEVSDLLKLTPACFRVCSENGQDILQVFTRSNQK